MTRGGSTLCCSVPPCLSSFVVRCSITESFLNHTIMQILWHWESLWNHLIISFLGSSGQHLLVTRQKLTTVAWLTLLCDVYAGSYGWRSAQNTGRVDRRQATLQVLPTHLSFIQTVRVKCKLWLCCVRCFHFHSNVIMMTPNIMTEREKLERESCENWDFFRNYKLEFAMYFLFTMRFCTLQMMTWDCWGWNLLPPYATSPCVGRHTAQSPSFKRANLKLDMTASHPKMADAENASKSYIGGPTTRFDTRQVSHCTWPEVDRLVIKFSTFTFNQEPVHSCNDRDMLLCNEIRQILTRIELFLEMWISTVPLFKRYVLPRCSPANYLPSGHFRHQNFHSNCSLILLQQFRSRWWTENCKFNLQQDHYLQRLKNNTRPLLLGIVSTIIVSSCLVYWATVCCLGAADETGEKIQEF